jgi:hypothetical protein
MNLLGASGLRSAAFKKKIREDKLTGANEIQELIAKLAAVTAERDELLQIVAQLQIQYGRVNIGMNGLDIKPAAKRSLVDDASGYEENKKPEKRRAIKKVPKEGDEEMDDAVDKAVMIPLTKKPRTKRTTKKEPDFIKLEEGIEDAAAAPVAPTRKRAACSKKAIKDESAHEGSVADDGETSKLADTSVAASKLSEESSVGAFVGNEVNAAVKEEYTEALNRDETDSQNNPTAAEVFGNGESYIPGVKDTDLEYAFSAALKVGEIENDWEGFLAKKKVEHNVEPKKKRGGRCKKSYVIRLHRRHI